MTVRAEHTAAIREAVASIPRGKVCSYGRVAEVAGLPRRARLVGRVLGEMSAAEELPWHRVIRANGTLAFEPGSRGYEKQSSRLIAEGVAVEEGRVDLARFGWQLSLDEQLWGPS